MAGMNIFKASAILSFCASVLAAPAADAKAEVEWTQPILRLPSNLEAEFSTFAANITPENIVLSESELAQFSNTTSEPFVGSAASLRERGVIGDDNRVLWDHLEYPYNAMGRVFINSPDGGFICSASLVGPRHVATAKHCLHDGATYTFSPNFFKGDRLGNGQATNVITIGDTDGCGPRDDWAILILDRRLGEEQGYLGAKVIDRNSQLNKPIFFHFGYPGDKGGETPYRQEAISASNVGSCSGNGPIETDADAVPGQSGGPLWINENGDRYQYGVLALTSCCGSGFAAGENFVNAVGRTRADFP